MTTVVSPSLDPSTAAIAKEVFANLGLVFWSFQLLPQVIQNYRSRSTGNLSFGMVLLWAAWACPFVAGALRANLAPPLIIQPNLFAFFSVICAVQIVYYARLPPSTSTADLETSLDHSVAATSPKAGQAPLGGDVGLPGDVHEESSKIVGTTDDFAIALSDETGEVKEAEPSSPPTHPNRRPISVTTAVILFALSLAVVAGGEAGLYYLTKALDASESASVRSLSTVIVSTAPFIVIIGLVPQFFDIFKQKSCKGISPIFLGLDILGGLFSIASLLFHEPPFDVVTALSYIGVVILDTVIVVLGIRLGF
ncbi:hypothetical protein DFJ73DRAFT_831300 [Zopfochytrium polystomum]|nr:hypothetical protein DFJ73DRAFT_831300 [Zopfochytrium polystomum]